MKINKIHQRLTKSRNLSSLPILQHACVRDGYVLTTDLVSWATSPCPSEIEDGIYLVVDNTLAKKVDSDTLSREDFPMPPEYRPSQADYQTTLSAKDLRWLMKGASEDETRYVLNGVAFDEEFAVSTDGRVLFRMKLDRSVVSESPFIIERDALKVLPTAAKTDIHIFSTSKLISLEFEDVRVLTRPRQGTYPNWRQVVPQLDRHNSVPMSSWLDLKFEKALQKAEGKGKSSQHLRFKRDESLPSMPAMDSLRKMVVLMPLRLPEPSPTESNLAIQYLERAGWKGETVYVNNENPYSPHIGVL